MRSQFRSQAVSAKEAPPSHKWFDLVTPERDTFRTRLLPEGGRFHSEARPWLDAHNQQSCRAQIGKMVDSELSTTADEQPVFRVLVWFDLADPNAAEIYRKHNTLASDGKPLLAGCSVGFDPIRKHVEIPSGTPECRNCNQGEINGKTCIACWGTGYTGATLVYDEWAILEGSSCPAPSNPSALMRSATETIQDAIEAAPPKPVHHPTTKVNEIMKPEHRSAHRNMVGDALQSAEGHMRLAGELGKDFPEHQAFHEGEARSAMTRAAKMCRMISDSMKAGHEDAPQDAALTANMVRSAPTGVSEGLAKEWDTCQRAALPFADMTFNDAAAQIGAKSARELLVQHRTNEQIIRLYHSGKAQERQAAASAEQKLCGELLESLRRSPAGLEPGLEAEMLGLDPQDPKRQQRKGQPWTSEMLRRMVVQLENERPVITRPAEVRSAEVTGAEPVVPAAVTRPTAATSKVDPAVEAFLNESARRTGTKPDNMRSAAERLS